MAEIKQIKIEAVGLKNIKNELDDIKKSMKDVTDPTEMAKLTAEANVLEKSLEGVNDKVKEFGEESTDSLNGVGKSFSDLKSAITELDLTKVQSQVDSFAKASAKVTFKGAITSLKTLGKTFLTLGKALLTNPIFLLAAVIVGIVAAVYKLLDSLGIIQMAIDALMKPIQYLIDLFYSLTDAMGLTNKAAQKAADEKAQAYEDSANRIESANNKIISSLDHEIRMAKLNGEDTVELERRKVKAIEETALARLRADAAAWQAGKLNKDLSEEEIETLKKKAFASQAAYFQMRDDVEYFEASVLATERENNNKRASEAISSEEKKEADRKQAAADRLATKRLEEDLDLQLMEEGDAKLLKQNKIFYERLIEDTKLNEKLTAEEKDRVIAQYQKLSDAKAEEIRKAKKEKDEAAGIQAQEELSAILYDLKTSEEQKALDDLDKYYDDTLKKLRENLEKGLITKEQFAEAEILLEEEKAEKIKEIKEKSEEDVEKLEETLAKLSDIISFAADNLDSSFGAALASGIQGISEFIALSEMEFESGIEEITAYATAAAGAISGILSAVQDANRKALEETLSDTEASTNEQLSLINSQIEAGVLSVEAGEEAKNAINAKSEQIKVQAQKKEFENDKKIQIAQANIAGMQGSLQAFAGAMQLGPIAGPILGGVLSAAVTAMTLVNISKIKATKFNSGGSGGGGGNIPTPKMPSTNTPTRQAPIVNFQGTGGNSNDVNAGGGNSNITIENRVSVSETEITDKQKTVHNLTNQSQL